VCVSITIWIAFFTGKALPALPRSGFHTDRDCGKLLAPGAQLGAKPMDIPKGPRESLRKLLKMF
jgi:hypothetical protein